MSIYKDQDEKYWAQLREEIKAGEYSNRSPYTAIEYEELAHGIRELRDIIERKEKLRARLIP